MAFRPIRPDADAEAVYALLASCIEPDQVDLDSTSEGLPDREEVRIALAGILPEHQQAAEIQGQIVGYSRVSSWLEDDGCWVYLILGWVRPDWRGQGLGTALLRWGEEAAKGSARARHPRERFEFAANASSTQPEASALLKQEGYAAQYSVLEMGLEFSALPPELPLPPGFEVRPVTAGQIPLIAASIAESYQDEYSGGRFRESLSLEESVARLSAPTQDPGLWQIAWADQQIAGQVIPQIEKGRGFLYDVSVRPAWRRQGLARALLSRAVWDLRRRGIGIIRIRTVAEFRTRARDLYHSLGFRVLKEFPRYRKTPPARGVARTDLPVRYS